MKRTGSNINGQNIDLNAADSAAHPGSLSAANHGNPDATYSDPVKAAHPGGSLGSGGAVRVLVGGHFIFHFRRRFRVSGSQI